MNRHSLFFASLCSLCLCGEVAFAHPIPTTNHDRIIDVQLARDGVTVDYSLEVGPETASKDLPPEEIAKITDYKEFYPTYLRHQKAALDAGLDARLDGRPLTFTCVESRCDPSANLYTFRYTAPWELEPGATHHFTFRENNYDQDTLSGLRLQLTADDSLQLSNVVAPSERLKARPGDYRKPGDDKLLRNASADVRVAESAAVPSPAVETPDKPPAPAPAPSQPSTLLHLLLDTRQGWGILLLLAAAFGAAHALTPGHGKTLVAAYLVGERGTVGHAVLLGVTTTLTHTAAVLVVAGLLPLLFPNAPPADVQRLLELVGGLLVAGLGIFLLNRRLTGGHDHIHIGGGHHHHHHGQDHDHSHEDHPHGPATAVPAAKVVWWRLIVLGVSGGIVPCWDAIAMLGLAISAHRLWLGLPLLLAFSTGLAGVLVAIGVGVVYAHRYAGHRFGGTERLRPLFRALPLVSAVFITVIGLWLCYSSMHG